MSRPEWIEALALACERTSQAVVATRLGYSPSVINQVLQDKYKGNLNNVQIRVEGAYMGRVVACPVLGEIPQDQCIDHQGRKFAATNPQRVRLYKACRAGCAHSRLTTQGGIRK